MAAQTKTATDSEMINKKTNPVTKFGKLPLLVERLNKIERLARLTIAIGISTVPLIAPLKEADPDNSKGIRKI
jgi:hypothetical protein